MVTPEIKIDLQPILDNLKDALRSMQDARKKTRIACNSLVEELKHNERVCHKGLEYDLELSTILPEFSREIYDEVCNSGVKLTAFRDKKISVRKPLQETVFASWQGKSTAKLIRKTYDKITELVEFYPIAPPEKIRPEQRLRNIQARIGMLLDTLDCDK
ncbi:MAG: hypothetical protein JXB38_14575 [Anaerolineales bacterium]|nr:hypothetical protein [Anaerolineales bacterium]